jgi:circadian clock protein KaiC
MKKSPKIERLKTGIKNLDALFGGEGGLPKGSITVLAGSPGAGKTTLAQQICFFNATKTERALIFQTLSEPSAKTMKYMSQFRFFKPEKVSESVEFIDLGGILRSNGIASASSTMMEHIKRVKPSLVMIDSFKVFDDLTANREEFRKFTYEIAVQLMAWEITGFLLGEYSTKDMETSPLFSVVDGIITMKSSDGPNEAERFLKIIKMRGTNHGLHSQIYEINEDGIEVKKLRLKSNR